MRTNQGLINYVRIRSLLLVNLLCFTIVGGACNATPTAISIEYVGHVFDRDTNLPVSNAKVTLDFQGIQPAVYTDSEGAYRFIINAESGEIYGRVRVEAENYEEYKLNVTLTADPTTISDIRLTPALSVSPTLSVLPTHPPIWAGTYTGKFSTDSTKFGGVYDVTLVILSDDTGTLQFDEFKYYEGPITVYTTTQTTATIVFYDMEGDQIGAVVTLDGERLHGTWKYNTGDLQYTAKGTIDVWRK